MANESFRVRDEVTGIVYPFQVRQTAYGVAVIGPHGEIVELEVNSGQFRALAWEPGGEDPVVNREFTASNERVIFDEDLTL